jgi:Cu(I)/Ag(I) efflux system periplasmic protein CusF
MRVTLPLLLALSMPAFAQPDHQTGQRADTGTVQMSEGLIKKIDKATGEIIIKHGELDSIGMPPMTMAFGVAKKSWLNKLKAGDKIRFLAEMKTGIPTVSRYEVVR